MASFTEQLAPYARPDNLFTNGFAISYALPDIGEMVKHAAAYIIGALYDIENVGDQIAIKGKVETASEITRKIADRLQEEMGSRVSLAMTMSVARELVEREAERKQFVEAFDHLRP